MLLRWDCVLILLFYGLNEFSFFKHTCLYDSKFCNKILWTDYVICLFFFFFLVSLCDLASEDLLIAVDKIDSSLSKKTNGCNFFRQDDIPSFDLGSHIVLIFLFSFFLIQPLQNNNVLLVNYFHYKIALCHNLIIHNLIIWIMNTASYHQLLSVYFRT